MSATWENFSQISKSEYIDYCNKYNWDLAQTVRNDLEVQNADQIFDRKWSEDEMNEIVNDIVNYSAASINETIN